MLSVKKIISSSTLLTALGITALFGILANSYVTFFWVDDFSMAYTLKNKGVLEFIWHQYINWDGRFLTLTGLIQASLFKLGDSFYSTLFWSTCYITAFFFVVKMQIKLNKLLATAIISSSFLIIFYAHLFETLYWATGGVYSMALMIGSIWLWYNSEQTRKLWLIALLSFIAGSTTQNLSTSLITIVLLDTIENYFKTHKINIENVIALGSLIAGTIFISFAPGNLNRANLLDPEWNIGAMINLLSNIYYTAFMQSEQIFIIAPVIALILHSNVKNQPNRLYLSFKYLIAAVASLAPFIILPAHLSISARINIFFQFFLFLSILNLSWLIIDWGREKPFFLFIEKLKKVKFHIFVAILLLANILITLNFKNGLIAKSAFKERETYIMTSQQDHVIVEPISRSRNLTTFMHFFQDITIDSTNWANEFTATYYNIKSIRIIEETEVTVK